MLAFVTLGTLATLVSAYLPGAPVVGRSAMLRVVQPSSVRCQEASETLVPKMESSCAFDFVPLQIALATGEFRDADQLTRDALITLAGPNALSRGYVYFTEAPKLPVEDMATIERLWQTYSKGKWGYSVQRQAFLSKKVNRQFEPLFERLGRKNR